MLRSPGRTLRLTAYSPSSLGATMILTSLEWPPLTKTKHPLPQLHPMQLHPIGYLGGFPRLQGSGSGSGQQPHRCPRAGPAGGKGPNTLCSALWPLPQLHTHSRFSACSSQASSGEVRSRPSPSAPVLSDTQYLAGEGVKHLCCHSPGRRALCLTVQVPRGGGHRTGTDGSLCVLTP